MPKASRTCHATIDLSGAFVHRLDQLNVLGANGALGQPCDAWAIVLAAGQPAVDLLLGELCSWTNNHCVVGLALDLVHLGVGLHQQVAFSWLRG